MKSGPFPSAQPDPVRTARDSAQRLEALGLVAAGIAHDFNNQLVSVLAEASAIREEGGLGEPAREALRRIEASANRMAQLTRQLLAYAGRGRFVTEIVDPDDLVRSAQERLAWMVPPGAALSLELAAGPVAIEADRSLLGQVVANLVANASDALAPGAGRIAIASQLVVRDGTSWWQLDVADDGCGIAPATLARIFDPFFSTKPGRHGLGLSAVHGIVRRLGGDLEVDSQPGGGARFLVRLPVVPGAQPARPPAVLQPASRTTLSGLRVLVADDEPSVRATVRRLLVRRGAAVVVAEDGREAEARLREGTYALIVLDVMMPGRTGYQLVGTARQLQPGAPVVLMSGYTEHSRGAGSEDEPDAFLEKPFSAAVLDAALDGLLGRRR